MDAMIGLEVHCRLNTASKLFCSCSSDPADKAPNEVTCPVCLGYPGYKPVVNKKAIDQVIAIGLALNCDIATTTFFSRKTYFYPDMSKNYQITQYELPIANEGSVMLDGETIRIRRAHLEEDPAKLSYPGGQITGDYVLVDYNRAGEPLSEIVTEPDFKSAAQARKFLQRLSTLLEYIGIYHGEREASIRVDANVSIQGGERVEVKNITGFENVEKAINYEIVRQRAAARTGKKIVRETRRYDDATKTTTHMRTKETEEDYGYIFDPDLPTLTIDKQWVSAVLSGLPELPDKRVERTVQKYGIKPEIAHLIVYQGKDFADFFEQCGLHYSNHDRLANWLVNYLLKSLNWRSERVSESKVTPQGFIEFMTLMDKGQITERFAKELIKQYVDTGTPPAQLAQKEKVELTEQKLIEIVEKTINGDAHALHDLREGKKEAVQYIVGKVLAQTAKQADPKLIKQIIEQRYASVAQ